MAERRIDLEALRKLLADPTVRYSDAASIFGVTRERIRQLHAHFEDSVPTVEQRRAAREERRLQLLRSIPPDLPYVRHVWDTAQRLGLTCSRIVIPHRRGASWIATHTLIIEGVLCGVRLATTAWAQRRTKVKYFRISRTPAMDETAMTLAVCSASDCPLRVYVFPTLLMLDYSRSGIFIPATAQPVYRNHHGRVDWEIYREAWDLLRRQS